MANDPRFRTIKRLSASMNQVIDLLYAGGELWEHEEVRSFHTHFNLFYNDGKRQTIQPSHKTVKALVDRGLLVRQQYQIGKFRVEYKLHWTARETLQNLKG